MTPAQTAGFLQSERAPLALSCFLADLYRYAVLSENGKVFYGFESEAIRTIIAHRFHKGRLIYHRDREGKLDGLFMWYRMPENWEWAAIRNWDDDDEGGKEIFMAFLFAESPETLADITLRFIEMEPDCLHLKLTGVRQRNRIPKRVEYSTKLLTRLIKNGRKKR